MTASSRSSDARLPVGLFGVAMKITRGRIISIARLIDPTSRSQARSSGTSMTCIPRARAVSRYITNVGVVVRMVLWRSPGRA